MSWYCWQELTYCNKDYSHQWDSRSGSQHAAWRKWAQDHPAKSLRYHLDIVTVGPFHTEKEAREHNEILGMDNVEDFPADYPEEYVQVALRFGCFEPGTRLNFVRYRTNANSRNNR